MPDAPHPALQQLFALAAAPSRLLASLEAGGRRRGPWREPALDEHPLLSEKSLIELLRSEPLGSSLAAAIAVLEQRTSATEVAEDTARVRRPAPASAPLSASLPQRPPPPAGMNTVEASVGPLALGAKASEAPPPQTRAGTSLPTRAAARAALEQRAARAGLAVALVTPIASSGPAESAEFVARVVTPSGPADPAEINARALEGEAASLSRSPQAFRSAHGTSDVSRESATEEVPSEPRVGMAGLVARLARLTGGVSPAGATCDAAQREAGGVRRAAQTTAPARRAMQAALPRAAWRAAPVQGSSGAGASEPAPSESAARAASEAPSHELLPRSVRERHDERDLAERLARILHREAERDGIDLDGFEP